jgi:hypothetical protein
VNTGRTAEAIADPERLGELVTIMTEGTSYGMQTFDQHLIALYRDGVVTLDDALGVASNPTTCGSPSATRAWSPDGPAARPLDPGGCWQHGRVRNRRSCGTA